MNGRTITWQQHALLSHSAVSSREHFDSVLSSPAIEVAWTKVVEGGVAGYYERFNKTVVGVLSDEPGCDGFFISPLIENPQDQVLLINWKSVDVSILPGRKRGKRDRNLTERIGAPRGFRKEARVQGLY
jgi:hypothetical protein